MPPSRHGLAGNGQDCIGIEGRGTLAGMDAITLDFAGLVSIIGSVVGTGLAVGLGLAVLIMRSTARVDADRRAADARFDTAMDAFRTNMQRLAERHAADMRSLAERQSHVEGRLDERGSAAD